ncbi:MAG: hypothetical protein HZA77_10200 [Candidatus Schekmanbacteria bacterium]|nr:hypothetical protein [Candidatus Schekmanbacteria bacterium]
MKHMKKMLAIILLSLATMIVSAEDTSKIVPKCIQIIKDRKAPPKTDCESCHIYCKGQIEIVEKFLSKLGDSKK